MSLHLLRDAFRLIRRRPVMSAAAVLSLALGMTINAASFNVLDALLFRPLPIREPAGLVRVIAGQRSDLSYPAFEEISAASQSIEGLAAFQLAGAIEDDGSRSPEVVSLGLVTANYFSTLGVNATRGRAVGEIDRADGAAPAVAISYDYWQSHFAGDANIIGRPIKLNTKPWTIVGVLPDGFAGTQPLFAPAVWMTTDAARRNGRALGTRSARARSGGIRRSRDWRPARRSNRRVPNSWRSASAWRTTTRTRT